MKKIIVFALVAAATGWLLASPAYATDKKPCKDKPTTTTTIKPTTITTQPCRHGTSTSTTVKSTTTTSTTAKPVPLVPLVTTTSTSLPHDDTYRPTEPAETGTDALPVLVEVATPLSLTADEQPQVLATTGSQTAHIAFLGLLLLGMGGLLRFAGHKRRQAIEGKAVKFQ